MKRLTHSGLALLLVALPLRPLAAQQSDFIPRAQDKPPGPALSPQEAIAKMTVPPGFAVELVASEPDIVNPVAMTIDERGRFWITESLEYPRKSPGPGQDRVKVLEDTDGDGRADKFTVFAEGLNIPSGIAVGYGGVWLANSPDILFLQDTDGDGRADRQEVVVTGFGRSDTHELPNSLTWGPDGWLYGLNGVFNHSHVRYPEKSPYYRADHPGWKFTCALFRIHPRTREFQVFAEGTSNPWGIAIDNEGSFFLSACVIDHLWHIAETGYYHRQGGPYPPYTWKIESIVKHKHQKAAYCGIHYFDSDAYPPEYRQRLYMGNIHGGCINVDVLKRDGSTYFATPAPDFLTANDAWFMPVVQKTGPDGSLYILDWYDRYHCYQDANRDPAGIDRLKGRLYRVRYGDTPRAKTFDLGKETDEALIARLGAGNDFIRHTAQRLLAERNTPASRSKLQQEVLDDSRPQITRLHALWALLGGDPLPGDFHAALLAHSHASFRAWGVRAAGDLRKFDDRIVHQFSKLVHDPSPDVQLQMAISAGKVDSLNRVSLLMAICAQCNEDRLIPHIVWQNLLPLLARQELLEHAVPPRHQQLIDELGKVDLDKSPGVRALLPHLLNRMLAAEVSPETVASLLRMFVEKPNANPEAGRACLSAVAERIQSGEMAGDRQAQIKRTLSDTLDQLLEQPLDSPLYFDAARLAALLGWAKGRAFLNEVLVDRKESDSRRLQAFDALVVATREAQHSPVLNAVERILDNPESASLALRGSLISGLGRADRGRVADLLLERYLQLEAELQSRTIELLTQRGSWTKALLARIANKEISPDVLNLNQVRKLLASKNTELVQQVTAVWGTLRTERSPQREEVIDRMRSFLRQTPGDPYAGIAVYKRVCGQCHKMHGEGQEVGPDITVNGRGSFEQLLSNVFDPSLVIGASYQARTVATKDGRILTGLLAEDSPERVVLKIQGGKLETIPRDNIDELEVSKLSMMPEDLEKQLKPQELADLFAYITLDKPPSDPTARQLPGLRDAAPQGK